MSKIFGFKKSVFKKILNFTKCSTPFPLNIYYSIWYCYDSILNCKVQSVSTSKPYSHKILGSSKWLALAVNLNILQYLIFAMRFFLSQHVYYCVYKIQGKNGTCFLKKIINSPFFCKILVRLGH